MREAASDFGTKALAVVVLLVATWILLKFVIGVVTTIAWIAVGIAALLAVVWAAGKLL